MQVSAQLQQICVAVHQNTLVSPLQKMADSIPLPIDVVRIATVNVMQHLVHVSIGGFYHKVIVVAHEHIAVKPVAIFILGFEKVFLEFIIITLPEKDRVYPDFPNRFSVEFAVCCD